MLHISRTVAAPAEDVLRLLRDTASWPRWGPSVRAVEGVEGLVAAGDRGHVVSVVGARLSFEVTSVEDRGREGGGWHWRVAGVPATSHAVRPHPSVQGSSVVTFGVPALAAPYLAVCALALRRVEHLATDGRH